MKLNFVLAITIIALTVICVNSRIRKTHRNRATDVTLVQQTAKKPKTYTGTKTTYSYKVEAAGDAFKLAYKEFSNKAAFTMIDRCIELIQEKMPHGESNYKLWYKLTEKTLNHHIPVKLKWLKQFAEANTIQNCNLELGENLKTPEQINAIGVGKLTKNVRSGLKKIVTAGQNKVMDRMNKLITAAASTYKNDRLVGKTFYNKLNLSSDKPAKKGAKARRRY
jgi:hypothetical protein